mgnify:CR=1 FL=1
MREKYKNYIEYDHSFEKLTMFGIICLIIVISGIFGFIYEFIFYYFNFGMKEFYYRGGNFLPWINIYAIGAVFIYFFTYKYRKKPIKVFLISMITSGILEYIGGLLLYKVGNGFRCWDYNTEILNFLNIDGFVCLRSVLFFGISALLLIYLIVPICFSLANKLDKKLFLIISISICSIFLMDEIYNLLVARIFNLKRASDIYKSLGVKYVNFK